ncbi:uncharacterized protein [Muntiacus reevesi]|uniref:uncharacterized protein n=1 Tax=Muntiacus reevesi TaxID=9886 RepID=UPI003306CD26
MRARIPGNLGFSQFWVETTERVPTDPEEGSSQDVRGLEAAQVRGSQRLRELAGQERGGPRLGAALRAPSKPGGACAERGHCHVLPSGSRSPGSGRSGPGGGARGGWGTAAAEPPKPSRMEVLDEFDSEFPQTVTFCQLISEEDFETQAATYTERALRRLFRSLDRNPALAERVAKASCAVQGELNCCNSMGALEMHQRLEQLKRRIHRVHLYSQDDKKRRRRWRPKKAERVVLQDRSTSPCLPPALPLPTPPLPPAASTASTAAPPPAIYTMPRVFGPFAPLPSTSPPGRPDPPGPQSWGLPLLVPDQEQRAHAPLPLDLSL